MVRPKNATEVVKGEMCSGVWLSTGEGLGQVSVGVEYQRRAQPLEAAPV
jgi:hypothetical protein